MSSQRLAKYINAPYEGVSQVPPQVALSGACKVMRNCLAQIPTGVGPRAPMEWAFKLFASDADPYGVFHRVPRGTPSEDLLLTITRDTTSYVPRLFNYDTLAPVAMNVDSFALAYINADTGGHPNKDLHLLSVEDTTFITNRNMLVADGSDFADTRPFEGMLWVKEGGYGKTYAVTVTPAIGTPVTASYATAGGGTASDAYQVDTSAIAKGLYDGTIPPHPGDLVITGMLTDLTSQGFTVTLDGPVIYISHPTTDFSMTVSDGTGGTAFTGIKDTVQRFSDLPIQAHDGLTVRIANAAVGGDSDYFVQFVKGSTSTTGTWKEVIEPGADLGLDPTTMPVRLFNHGTDLAPDWHLEIAPWGQRTTGNATLSLDPSFLGDTLQATAWTLGRLVLVATGVVYLSASDDPFKFYKTTLATSLDSDPIGLLSPTSSKVFFRDAATFDEKLVVFANEGQCVLTTGDQVSPSSAKLSLFSTSPYSPQLPLRENFGKIYYAAGGSETQDKALNVYEFALDRIAGVVQPKIMTAAVPQYLPKGLDRSTQFKTGYLILYGQSGSGILYPHYCRYDGPDNVQNSWSDWSLPDGWVLQGLTSRGSVVTLFVAHVATGQGHVVRMDLAQGNLDPAPAVTLQKLDFKVSTANLAAVSVVGGYSTFTLPFPFLVGSIGVSVQAGSSPDFPEAYLPVIHQVNSPSITLEGDWTGQQLWFGMYYDAYFTPHRWYVPDTNGAPRKDGRFTVSKVTADIAKFGYLRAEVLVKGRALRTTEYQGYNLDDAETTLDNPQNYAATTLRFPIGGKNEDVTVTFHSDSHLGFQFMGYQWEGNYNVQATIT